MSVNVGKEQSIEAKSGKTGIYKTPTIEPVHVGHEGLQGDVIISTKSHGGVDQAVYVYGTTDYEWWSETLQKGLAPGTFGENITISNLESSTLCVGDRLSAGTIILEVTAPRFPCITLATRMNDPQFVTKFRNSGRYGAYCRVIKIGQIQVGNPVIKSQYEGTLVRINELYHTSPLDSTQIRRLLSAPIAVRSRRYFEEQLAKLQ